MDQLGPCIAQVPNHFYSVYFKRIHMIKVGISHYESIMHPCDLFNISIISLFVVLYIYNIPAVLKYMAKEGCDRKEAQGNMDAFLDNCADWTYQKSKFV